jgi:hypothetical protein
MSEKETPEIVEEVVEEAPETELLVKIQFEAGMMDSDHGDKPLAAKMAEWLETGFKKEFSLVRGVAVLDSQGKILAFNDVEPEEEYTNPYMNKVETSTVRAGEDGEKIIKIKRLKEKAKG